MKKAGFVIVSIIFLFSCKNATKVKPNTDSVKVIYLSAQGYQLARAVDSIYTTHKLDSSDNIIHKQDTAWTIEIPTKDTLKDIKGNPIYDSLHHQYQFNQMWYKLTPQENATIKIQILNI